MPNQYYRVVKQHPLYRQMSTDDLFDPSFQAPELITANLANTRTFVTDLLDPKAVRSDYTRALIGRLKWFCSAYQPLYEVPRETLYRHYRIPKKSGGFRPIDQPVDELQSALAVLKAIFEHDFGALYHTSAFAYVPHRSNRDCVTRHQRNESNWFAKFDLENFFGSTTLDFVYSMLSRVYPFCLVVQYEDGREALRKALSLAFLRGGLPQGTKISPLITNLMMIPIDYELFNTLRNFGKQYYVYTRYADDFIISSKYDFKFMEIQDLIQSVLRKYNAPFHIKKAKTHYGSRAGANWILGIMLNKDNEMTVGYQRKKRFQSALHNFLRDKEAGVSWDLDDVRHLLGLHAYYRSIEPQNIDAIVQHVAQKHHADPLAALKSVLQDPTSVPVTPVPATPVDVFPDDPDDACPW